MEKKTKKKLFTIIIIFVSLMLVGVIGFHLAVNVLFSKVTNVITDTDILRNENGKIEALQDPDTATTYYPIPIRSLFVGSKIHGNYEAKDANNISWQYPDNYSDDLAIVTPSDFNPLTDLIPA